MTYRRHIPASEAQRRQWVNANAKHVGKKCVYRDPQCSVRKPQPMADMGQQFSWLHDMARAARARGDIQKAGRFERRAARIRALAGRLSAARS